MGGLAILGEYLPAPGVPGGLLDREALEFYCFLRLLKLHECGGLAFRNLRPELRGRRCVTAAVGIVSRSFCKGIQGWLRLLLLQIDPGD